MVQRVAWVIQRAVRVIQAGGSCDSAGGSGALVLLALAVALVLAPGLTLARVPALALDWARSRNRRRGKWITLT